MRHKIMTHNMFLKAMGATPPAVTRTRGKLPTKAEVIAARWGTPLVIDHFYQLQHRRLRERFGLARVERHEAWVMRALAKRHASHA